MAETVEIFCCYARKDRRLLDELRIYLHPLERSGLIDIWYDASITPGKEWDKEIKMHLNRAQIILLLISPDFMASDYINNVELKRAIERHKHGEARVIPILLRPIPWQNASFEKLQALPTGAKPVTKWRTKDDAFSDIAVNIHRVIGELTDSVFINTIEPFININSSIINGEISFVQDDVVKLFILGPLGSGKTTAVNCVHYFARRRDCDVEHINEYDILLQMSEKFDFSPTLGEVSRILEENVRARGGLNHDSSLYSDDISDKRSNQIKLITIELAHPAHCLSLSVFNKQFLQDAYYLFTNVDRKTYLERNNSGVSGSILDYSLYRPQDETWWDTFYPKSSWKDALHSLNHKYNKFLIIDNNTITMQEFHDIVRNFIDLIISLENIRLNEKRGNVIL